MVTASRYSLFLRILLLLALLAGLLAGGAWWWLTQGFTLARLDLPAVKIESLSLRLEEKLIIAAKQVVLKKGGKGPIKASDIDRLTSWTKKALPLAQSIHIDQLVAGDMHTSVTFAHNTLHLDGTHFSVAASVAYREGSFSFQIHDLLVKAYDARMQGAATLGVDTGRITFSGPFQALGLTGTVELLYGQELLEVVFHTAPFTDLAGALKPLPVPHEVTSWIEQNITAKSYQVDRFLLRLPFHGKTPDFDPNGIEMTAVAHDAEITFHPDRSPVHCNTLDIHWQNDRLSFALSQPSYANISLQGSRVHITPLIAPRSRLHINLTAATSLDTTVLDLLEAYHINLPLFQQSGTTRADMEIAVDLHDFSTRVKGDFTTGKGEWLLAGVPLEAERVSVSLDNNLVEISNADVRYKDFLHTGVSGSINTSNKRADLQLDIDRLLVRQGDFHLLEGADITTPLVIDYGKQPVPLILPEVKTALTLAGNNIFIDLTDLKAAAPFIPGLQKLPFDHGSATIIRTNRLDHTFQGSIAITNDLLTYENDPVTTFHFHGISTPDKIKVWANQERIVATVTTSEEDRQPALQVVLKDYHVNYAISSRSLENHRLPLPVHIRGEQALLQADKLDLEVNNFTIDIKDNDLTVTADMEQGTLYLEKRAGEITLAVTELDAKVLQNAIDFLDLEEGRLNFKAVGTPEKYEGWLEFTNVLLRDYIVLQNSLAFLDTIPALATFSSPGFDSEGYRIKDGIMHFTMDDELLTVHNFRTDGVTVNSQSKGWIDFTKRILDFDLDLMLMKNLSAIIDMIPLVGYAIQGEDGYLTTSLKITGDIDQPEITTNLTEDIVLAPLNILHRTIVWPFKQLEKVME